MVSPILVCHQLRSPDNLAAIARVMANFGFTELILSDPQTHDFRGLDKLAIKADVVLQRFSVALTLEEALRDVVYAVGVGKDLSKYGLEDYMEIKYLCIGGI